MKVWVTLICGLSLLIPWVLVSFLPDIPNGGSVYPGWFWSLFFSFLFLGHLGELTSDILAMMIPALFFFAWNPQLFQGSVKVPRRTYALFALGAVLSLVYFLSAWSEGIRVEGDSYTYSVFAADIAMLATLAFMFASAGREKQSFRTNMFLHWTLFIWLFWFAFPFLGQLTFP